MKIVFDNIIYTLQKAGGISVVWTNLITRVMKVWPNILFIEYGENDNISKQSFVIKEDLIEHKSKSFLTLKRYINPKFHAKEPYIFHSSYYRICNDPNAINITTVHDFTYERYVKSPFKRWIHCRQKHAAIRKSDAVVCISQNTKEDLLKILPDVAEQKIKVIHNGVDEQFHILNACVPEDYVLFVGNRDPYKNFDKIIAPICEMGIPLKIVGAPLNNKEFQLLNQAGCNFTHLGYVSNTELNRLYNKAICLLYPSEYEGFGLPVIEAQKAGCPVIAYNGSSIKEIIGDNTLLLQNTTKEEFISKLKLLANPEIRQQVIFKGLQNARNYSWDKMAEEYISLYKQMAVLWEKE